MPRDPLRLGLGLAVWTAALLALVAAAGVNLQRDVAPIGAAFSLVVAVTLYLSRERSERRRKTLELFEKQLSDPLLRAAIHGVRLAVTEGTYREFPNDDPSSHLAQTNHVLNYLETSCAGVRSGLYDSDLLREFLGPLARFMIEEFLVEPADGRLPTRVFLPLGAGTEGVASEEALLPFPNLRAVFPDEVCAAAGRVSRYRSMPTIH